MAVQVPEISPGSVELATIEALAPDQRSGLARRGSTLLHNTEIALPAAGLIFMVLACFMRASLVILPIARPERRQPFLFERAAVVAGSHPRNGLARR